MKRIKALAAFLALAVLIIAFPVSVTATTTEGIEYVIDESTNTVQIVGYSGNAEILTVPSEIKGLPVVTIATFAFNECHSIRELVIPGSVHQVLDYAFFYCSNLEKVTFGEGVKSIGSWAFGDCKSLVSVELPEGLERIGDCAFVFASSLRSLVIPKSVTSIGKSIIAGCDSLTNLSVKEGNSVYHSASNCIIETERKVLFLGCSVSVIPADGSVVIIGNSAFYDCGKLSSVEIPASVSKISNAAFKDCENITSVTFPAELTYIGDNAFQRCTSLSTVYYKGTARQWREVEVGVYNEPLFESTVVVKKLAGDVDDDGKITGMDSNLVVRIISGSIDNIDEAKLEAADVNRDGRLNAIDANAIKRLIRGA